jgi:hypothetical protein
MKPNGVTKICNALTRTKPENWFQVTLQPCLQQVFITRWRSNSRFREQITNSGYMKPNIALRKTMTMGNRSNFKSAVGKPAMNQVYGYDDLNIIH